jgi:hypothetical protein
VEKPLLRITGQDLASGVCEFSNDGRFVVLGSIDGTVTLLELKEVQSRLADAVLGW